ncbi:MAG: DNA recombination protein RmuC [Leptospiraceae bacterium]|nr:DNA recombination protein RmuC [Leptospiraceae bacterium]MCK6381536.1 DNA recombination protein RmuC [Leptospiraceae bacterium]NUM41058.1 DNA recombination protein RmuC [Leptospiraceae bacterium]
MGDSIMYIAIGALVLNVLTLLVVLLKKGAVSSQVGDFQNIESGLKVIGTLLERIDKVFREETRATREEFSKYAKDGREETGKSFITFRDYVMKSMGDLGVSQKGQLDTFNQQLIEMTKLNDSKMQSIRETVDNRLKLLQEENSARLEKMRETVDEKLQSTLEKRLSESFTLVSERLEMVHKGLGEMQSLAVGVGDLKKVLTNVKSRGTWGEVQLGNLLEELLTKDQFEKNVITKKDSNDRVEFAIKLPGKEKTTYIPIDAKFPIENYLKLVEASERSDKDQVEEYAKNLEKTLKEEAKKIKDKYIDPPNTTDYAFMYLPIEGLYAEALRRVGLAETLQREFRVVIAGPTTISAILNSLQMGFRTLTIEKRSSEVWELLSAVKTEFGKFGQVLEKISDKIKQAGNELDNAGKRSRVISKKLKEVSEIESSQAEKILGTEDVNLLDED